MRALVLRCLSPCFAFPFLDGLGRRCFAQLGLAFDDFRTVVFADARSRPDLANVAVSGRRHVANVHYPGIRCYGGDTLKEVLTRMSSARIHRIYLCDDKGFIIRVVSLGDILVKFTAALASLDVLPAQ